MSINHVINSTQKPLHLERLNYLFFSTIIIFHYLRKRRGKTGPNCLSLKISAYWNVWCLLDFCLPTSYKRVWILCNALTQTAELIPLYGTFKTIVSLGITKSRKNEGKHQSDSLESSTSNEAVITWKLIGPTASSTIARGAAHRAEKSSNLMCHCTRICNKCGH